MCVIVVDIINAGCSFEKYVRDHESSQPVTTSSASSPTHQLYSPVSPLHVDTGICNVPTIASNQAESVPCSTLSSCVAGGDTVPSVLPSSKAIPRTEKSIDPISSSDSITVPLTTASATTQPHTKEIPQVTDNIQQPVASTNITKDTISEY